MYADLRPDNTRAIQVLVDDHWYDGELEAYRRDGDRWLGWVRWSLSPGAQHIGWYDADHLRQPEAS